MGLLDIPAPLFDLLAPVLSFLPAPVQLMFWGAVCGAFSMWLYQVMSGQDKIGAIKAETIAARKALAGYEGHEFDEMMPLALNVLKLSGKHFMTVIGPAVLSSLPALTLIVWVSNNFGYITPEPGTAVTVSVTPETELALPQNASGESQVNWPDAEEPVAVASTDGQSLFTVTGARSPLIHKKIWWNSLIANPAGYLDDDSPLELVTVDLQAHEYLPFGPDWLREWAGLFFITLLVVSIGIKVIFKIH